MKRLLCKTHSFVHVRVVWDFLLVLSWRITFSWNNREELRDYVSTFIKYFDLNSSISCSTCLNIEYYSSLQTFKNIFDILQSTETCSNVFLFLCFSIILQIDNQCIKIFADKLRGTQTLKRETYTSFIKCSWLALFMIPAVYKFYCFCY